MFDEMYFFLPLFFKVKFYLNAYLNNCVVINLTLWSFSFLQLLEKEYMLTVFFRTSYGHSLAYCVIFRLALVVSNIFLNCNYIHEFVKLEFYILFFSYTLNGKITKKKKKLIVYVNSYSSLTFNDIVPKEIFLFKFVQV